MTRRVIVHVGQMKSGTTFIQTTLAKNRDRLSDANLIYPGKKINQQHACYGLCGNDIYWVRDQLRWSHLGDSLLSDLRDFDGDVLISAEALSCMPEQAVDRFVKQLGGIDRVVITARNLLNTLLSAWQQGVKAGSHESLPDFFVRMNRTRGAGEALWRNYSFGNTARWWSKHADVSFVVVEHFAKDDLIDAFLCASGVDELELEQPSLNAQERNISLTWEDVEVLREINRLNNSLDSSRAREYRTYLLQTLLFPAAELGGEKIPFPAEHLEMATTWAQDEIAKIPADTAVFGDAALLRSQEFVQLAPMAESGVDIAARMNRLLYMHFDRAASSA